MKKICAANWKLQKSPAETRKFLTDLKAQTLPSAAELMIFPPASSWETTSSLLNGSSIKWGAQNVWSQGSGAFTGENSAAILKEMGGQVALVGHSERRKIFGEGDAWMADKVAYVQSLGLAPLFCIGETLEEREANKTDEVNKRQLQAGLSKADKSKPVIVAYEPVWAIGTGKVAQPEQVQAAHAAIHRELEAMGFGKTPILYGGSVKADNAGALGKIPHVDGFLIGGASLEVASFLAIANA